MKVLTISIAAYNVEKFLGKALESICIPEIIEDIEVLVIDDGSKDKTKEVAKRYEQVYPNSIKYIGKENGGHGSTINKGMSLATGKYFRVLDGDDYFDKESFVKYVKKLKNTCTDLILTNFMVVNSKGYLKEDPSILINGKNPFDDLQENIVCNFDKKVSTRVFGLSSVTIRTDLLKKANVQITEKCFYVDVEFILWCILLSEHYEFWNIFLYMYLKDENGNNSVSKYNMLKNVLMQEKVSKKICSIYEMFKNNSNKAKLSLVLERVAISVGATERTYMMIDNRRESLENIVRFDNELKKDFPVAYSDLKADRFLRICRKYGYTLLPMVRIAYRMYVNRGIKI